MSRDFQRRFFVCETPNDRRKNKNMRGVLIMQNDMTSSVIPPRGRVNVSVRFVHRLELRGWLDRLFPVTSSVISHAPRLQVPHEKSELRGQ